MTGTFERVADWVIRHPWIVSILMLALTVVTAIGQYDPTLLLPEPPPAAPLPQRIDSGVSAPHVAPVRVAHGDVILVAQSDDFFSPAGAAAMRAVVDALEALPYVEQILWMDRAPQLNIFGLPEPLLPAENASATRFQAARQKALRHPLVAGQLLSPDARTMLLMVRIDWLFVTDDADVTTRLRDVAQRTAASYEDADIAFQVTGNVPIRLLTASSNVANERKYQAIAYGIVLLMAVVLFRGISAVVIVALAPALGVFWTLGVLHLVNLQDNPFNAVVLPLLLCMVGFTDGVHMMVQIRRYRAAGDEPRQAARAGLRDVGLACFLTSLTTAIGFGSLALAHHEVVREFGYSCVIGVGMTFLSVITVIPLACSTRLGRSVHAGHSRNLIDRNLTRISVIIDWVLKYPRLVGWTGIVSTLLLAAVALTLRPDQRLTSLLPRNHEAVAALHHIDKVLGGMETAHVEITWSPDVAADDPQVGQIVSRVDAVLQDQPLIGNPISIHSLVAALPGEGALAQRMSLLELLPPPLKRAYYRPESRYAQVTFRVQDLGIATYGPVFQRLEHQLRQIERQNPQFVLRLEGDAVWRWRNLYQIVVDLAASLGAASLIIFVVLGVVYRSVRIGLISVVPNLFPLAATGAALVLVGQNLEIVSVCAFTVCLGIAVDDTIHFLTRFREEQGRTASDQEAIRRAFVGVGTALIMTTVVLLIGFATALTSDARDHRIFAAMGMLTIATALFADLVFLPALLSWLCPPSPHRPSNRCTAPDRPETPVASSDDFQ